jgi:predicted enzyme related to lactoylglutathione lyase
MADSQINRWSVAPYFLVPDVVLAADYYRDKLGFSYDRFWGEPPCFCMVRRNGIVVMLSQTPNSASVKPNGIAEGNDAWDAYIWVEDADALHAEFVSRGAKIARGLCDQEYGCRDFDVLDLNGYRLCFGQDLDR